MMKHTRQFHDETLLESIRQKIWSVAGEINGGPWSIQIKVKCIFPGAYVVQAPWQITTNHVLDLA